MKIEASTKWLELIYPGLYGTLLGTFYEDVGEEYEVDFKRVLCKTAKEVINEIFYENIEELHGNCFIDNVSFESPQFYNYGNDWLEFDLYVPDATIDFIKRDYFSNENCRKEFLNYAKESYGSYDGFISFFPYDKEDFENAINHKLNNTKFEMAIVMYIMFVISKGDSDLEYWQHDFEDIIEEEGSYNGWYVYEEEDV